jgi:hypothetical protein
MPKAIQTQRNEGVKISEANARRMVSNATTSRETSADQTTRIDCTVATVPYPFGLLNAIFPWNQLYHIMYS